MVLYVKICMSKLLQINDFFYTILLGSEEPGLEIKTSLFFASKTQVRELPISMRRSQSSVN